ncbi:hypothetical protein, partial [Acetobacter senegalensis]|uniref:hypothetical protein n=1 Tax=Acetobacter senegalensis TaxID=446692 RepID=UPI00264CB65B
ERRLALLWRLGRPMNCHWCGGEKSLRVFENKNYIISVCYAFPILLKFDGISSNLQKYLILGRIPFPVLRSCSSVAARVLGDFNGKTLYKDGQMMLGKFRPTYAAALG